ncbi:hypothetical protein VCHC67A1_02401B, partial [Vibrio cholerae HC-67A1]
LLLML